MKSPCELLTFSIQGKYKQSNLPKSHWSGHLCSTYPVSWPYSFVSKLWVTGTTILCCVPQPVDWSGRRPHRVHRWSFSKWNTISWWGLAACCRAVYRCGKCATHAQVHACTDMFSKTLDTLDNLGQKVKDKRTKACLIRFQCYHSIFQMFLVLSWMWFIAIFQSQTYRKIMIRISISSLLLC